MKSIRYQIFGRVQGVAYRAFTRDKANELGVIGWVKNKPDGSVECIASASNEILQLLEAELAKGPRWGRVDRIEKQQLDELCDLPGFEVRY